MTLRRILPGLAILALAGGVLAEEAPLKVLRGPFEQAHRQPEGVLSGITVFVSPGHGWTADPNDQYPENGDATWFLQRPHVVIDGEPTEVVEDYGNLDQANAFAIYAYNAGATVVPMRPLGFQENEVVLDNVDEGVTFFGDWTEADSSVYYGYGDPGEVPYRTATIDPEGESARARYRPEILEAGHYPVYTWVAHGPDRANQLYRIRHAGGTSEIRVNHRRVGRGWVWLGTYWFDAGHSGFVEVSNHGPGEEPGRIAVADAIRFGNGMGDIDRGHGVSGYARHEEASLYWVRNMVGKDPDPENNLEPIHNNPRLEDRRNNVGAPARMATHMVRHGEEHFFERVYLSFHSNASSNPNSHGVVGLMDRNNPTPNQEEYALTLDGELTRHVQTLDEGVVFPWEFLDAHPNLYAATFGELQNNKFHSQMDATIMEVAYHDRFPDSYFLADPKFRLAIGRASVHGIIRYLHEVGEAVPLIFPPEPSSAPRAEGIAPGEVRLSWSPPLPDPVGGDEPTGYVVYRSKNGRGFEYARTVEGADTLSVTFRGLEPASIHHYRVASVNDAGESLQTETVAVRVPEEAGEPRVLLVNGFDRFDKEIAPQNTIPTNVGSTNARGATFRIMRPHRMNRFGYTLEYGEALAAHGIGFDSAGRLAIESGEATPSAYTAVIWAAGQQGAADRIFLPPEMDALEDYLEMGGALFLSGSLVAETLAEDERGLAFLERFASATGPGPEINPHRLTAAEDGPLAGLTPIAFPEDSGADYRLLALRGLEVNGDAAAVLHCGDGEAVTGLFANGEGASRVALLAFPFEAVPGTEERTELMGAVMEFLRGE